MFDEDEIFEDITEEDEDKEEDYEERSYADPNEKGPSFINDPWPKTVFILIMIGFGFVLLTPSAIWSQWLYYLIITYGLLVLVGVSSVISIGVWRDAGGSRLRWGGLTNLIVVLVCGVIGTLDAIWMVTTGTSVLPGSNTPVLGLAAVIVLFSLYALWLIQRTFKTEATI